VSDIDTAQLVDSLKALDPNRPIREADIASCTAHVCFSPKADTDFLTPLSANALAISS
jgi:hypothetical protein